MSILDNEGHDPNGLGNRPTRPGAATWRPIETLHRIDTQIVLWNPCDGVHTLPVTIGLADLDVIRGGGVFTHWQRLEGPPSNQDKGR